jgi:hypothetical protein
MFRLRYEDKSVNAVKEIIYIFSRESYENTQICTLHEQNSEFHNVNTGYTWKPLALKG